jgi:DNA-directed RNA polymerase beta subunit
VEIVSTGPHKGDIMGSLLGCKRLRRSFGTIPKIVTFPNLIEMQRESYARFLQRDVPPEKREDVGLQAAFNTEIFQLVIFDRGNPAFLRVDGIYQNFNAH